MFGRGKRNTLAGQHRMWLEDYDPRCEQYYDENINSYRRGPGSYMPREQQPYYRRQHHLPYKLYVRDIHINTTEEGLYNAFSQFGRPIVAKKVNRYKEPYAFVEFATQREADNAIAGLHQQPPLYWCVTYALNQHDSIDSFMEEFRSVLNDELEEAINSELEESVLPLTSENLELFNRSEYPPCILCGVPAYFNCNNCKTRYCSKRCQSADWPNHRSICVPPPPLVPSYVTDHISPPIVRPIPNTGQPVPSMIESTGRHPPEVPILHREQVINVAKSSSEFDSKATYLQKRNSNAESAISCELKSTCVAEYQHAVPSTRQPSSQPHRFINQPKPMQSSSTSINPPEVHLNSNSSPSSLPYPDSATDTGVVRRDNRSLSRIEPAVEQNKNQSSFQFQKREHKSLGKKDNEAISNHSQRNFEHRRVPDGWKNESKQCPGDAIQNKTSKFDLSTREQANSLPKISSQLNLSHHRPVMAARVYENGCLKLNWGSNLAITVCFARSPDDFYIHLNSILAPLNNLLAKMQTSIEQCSPLSNPVVGLPCSAIFDGMWYRAVIVSCMEKDVGIRFVDYGNTIKYQNTVEYVRSLDEEFSHNRFYAIKVKLAGIEPAHGLKWDEKAKSFFKELTENQSFLLDVVDAADEVAKVRLKKKEENIDIGDYLVQQGVARKITGKIATTSLEPSHMQTTPTKSNAPLKTIKPADGTAQGITSVKSPPDISANDRSSSINSINRCNPKESNFVVRNDSRSSSPKKRSSNNSPVKKTSPKNSAANNLAKKYTTDSSVTNDRNTSGLSNKKLPSVIDDLKVKDVATFMVGVSWDPETKTCAGSIISSSATESVAEFHSLIESSVSGSNFSPSVGSLIAAYSIELGQWFRAYILKNNNQKYTVLYVDYGNVEDVVLVRPIPVNLNYAALGVRIVFSENLTSEANCYCKERMDVNTLHKLEVLEKLSNGRVKCLLKDEANLSTLSEVVVENWTLMISVSADMNPVDKVVRTSQMINEMVFNAGYNADVLVSEIKDLDNIYVQLLASKTVDALNVIQSDLNAICPKLPAPKEYPSAGTFVAALFLEDGNFYRAKVETIADNLVTVFYVDFGNSSSVTLDQIRMLPSHLFGYVSCCNRVGLASIETCEQLPKELTSFLQEFVGQQFFMFVKDTNPYKVLLTKDGVVLNDKINQMLRNSSHSLEETCTSATETVKEIGHLATGTVKESSTSAMEAAKGICISATEAVEKLPRLVRDNPSALEDVHVDNRIGNYKYEDGPFVEFPDDGQPFKARVLDADNPQTLQICPDDRNIFAKLEDLQKEMARYADGILHGHSPEVGDICLVRSPENGAWYRAACLSVVEQEMGSSYAVIFVDNGQINCVGVDHIRRIPKRFVDWIPYVSQHAVLKGFENYTEVEDDLAKKIASFIPINESIVMRIVGRIEDAFIVDIPSIESKLKDEGII